MQNSSVDLRRLSARDTVAGDPGASIQGINTFNLPDGAIVWCSETKCDYQFDRSSTQTGGGAVTPSAGPGRWYPVPAETPAYITQATWYVDSVDGNDSNDGATALSALRTLAELTRRTEGKVLLPSFSAFIVNLAGTFPTEPLSLNFSVSAFCWVQVIAETQVDYTGSITGFTTYSAGVTAALLDDAAAAFVAGDLNKRVRLTSGAGIGAVSFAMKVISGTQLRVGDFYTYGATGFALPVLTATPANGTTFVVEQLTCQVGGLDIVIDGGHAAARVEGVEFIKPATVTRTSLRLWTSGLTVASKLFGCRMNTTGANMSLNNSVATIVSCLWAGNGAPIFSDGGVQAYGMIAAAPINVTQNMSFIGISLFLQGGVNSTVCTVAKNAVMSMSGNIAAYDATGEAAMIVDDRACVVLSGATAFWGIGAATTYGINVRTGGYLQYVTKPTVSGGTSDARVGGTNKAWADIPFIEPANNAALVVRAA